MMPRPMTPTVSDFFFPDPACPAEARLFFCGERRPGVVVAILFLECDWRIEQRADARRREDLARAPRRGNPAVADENDALDLRNDFLDVMGDQDDCRPRSGDLSDALGEI